jgi:hypothetical protein
LPRVLSLVSEGVREASYNTSAVAVGQRRDASRLDPFYAALMTFSYTLSAFFVHGPLLYGSLEL